MDEGFNEAGRPDHRGHRERLRERFRRDGADALPDYELLELILFRAMTPSPLPSGLSRNSAHSQKLSTLPMPVFANSTASAKR